MKRAAALISMCLAAAGAHAQVSYDRLLKAGAEPQNWLTYSGQYNGWRYSTLKQIDATNVSRLDMAWAFQVADLGQFETSVLAVDGVLYGTGQNNRAFALDARTGRAIWRYKRALPEKLRACCGTVNRGFAILGDRLYMTTLDAHVMALDTRSGQVVWDVQAADYRRGYAMTGAPLVVKNLIIVGSAGGEYGARGFIDAYDAATGKRVWRFDTVPAPGQPGSETWPADAWKIGGAPAWITGSFDPELNTLYWPTGNPSPATYGGSRKGDNLYSNSMLALDPDTGKLKWHFQFTPHDLHDYDATQIPVLVDREWRGQPRKLLLQANRNGFVYVLDRVTGEYLSAAAFGKVTWASGIDAHGRPIANPAAVPNEGGATVCPGALGVTNWYSPSYSPVTQWMYVAVSNECDVFTGAPQTYRDGHDYNGSIYVPQDGARSTGAMIALDPFTGERKWEFKYVNNPDAGALATAGGVVFTGDSTGNVMALDAASGKDLWHRQLGAAIYASPVTYEVGGEQFVVIPSGAALFAFKLSRP